MDKYDVGIIGAGIAGSCLAIMLAEAGKRVIVFEKEEYPTHKVCGEFISMESYAFFKDLGLPLDDWGLPIINRLHLTSEKGGELRTPMDTGGFGLSRYKLDYELSQQMLKSGVTLKINTKVTKVQGKTIHTEGSTVKTDLVIGSHGKYTPRYIQTKKTAHTENFIAVKYHITGDFDPGLISLHSFDGGYCGMSRIENGKYCLCYLVKAQKLKDNQNQIKLLETNVLFKNLKLKQVFSQATFVWDKPLVISNIKFTKKSLFFDNTIFVGDAAGSISPLSGNGMSIAAKSSLILSQLILKEMPFNRLINRYSILWNKEFLSKIKKAKLLNTVMLNPISHHLVLKLLKYVGPLRRKVINDMQGKPFVRNTNLIR